MCHNVGLFGFLLSGLSRLLESRCLFHMLGTFLALVPHLTFPPFLSLCSLSLLLKWKYGLLAVHSPLSLSSLEFTLLSF